jgi:hypothetical protein
LDIIDNRETLDAPITARDNRGGIVMLEEERNSELQKVEVGAEECWCLGRKAAEVPIRQALK